MEHIGADPSFICGADVIVISGSPRSGTSFVRDIVDKISFGMSIYTNRPSNPNVGDTYINTTKGGLVELYTDNGWVALCETSEEIKTEIKKAKKTNDFGKIKTRILDL